jgi:predicted O-methyltransferase YrrM
MKLKHVQQHIAGIPFILPELARDIYDFILEQQPRHCLELGFGHGASSCIIAAALEEAGHGHLTAVDLEPAREWQRPGIEDLLERTGLTPWVNVVREPTSYTWFLKRMIAERSENGTCRPLYDFCFLDGAKNWTIDSAAFFLMDKLLRAEGWLLFDDLQWTYASKKAEGKQVSDGIALRAMGPDELEEPHIELIFQLLVMQHPDYANFHIKDNWWAWAQKTRKGRRVPTYEHSPAYRRRLAEWEARTGRRHRAPFEPFQK